MVRIMRALRESETLAEIHTDKRTTIKRYKEWEPPKSSNRVLICLTHSVLVCGLTAGVFYALVRRSAGSITGGEEELNAPA